jgi:hypothetical protein
MASRSKTIIQIAVAAALILVSSVSTAQWRFEPIVKVGGEYDDNATLDDRTDQEISLSGYLLEGVLDITYSSPLTTFSLTPRAMSRNYSDNPEFESTDLFLASRYTRQMRNGAFGLRFNYDRQTVRTAERADTNLDTEDPDEIPNDDSGRVGLLGDRNKFRIVPNYTYQFSESSSISANIDYTDVSYEDIFLNLLTDYTDARLNLDYRHAFSNRNAFLVNVTARHYEGDDLLSSTVDGVGGMVGFERSLSPTTTLRAMVGAENADDGTNNSTEPVGSVTLSRRLETINILAQYRRTISASGAGRVSVRDQININFTRRLNEKISAGIGIRAYQSKGVGDSVSIDDRDYMQLRTKFSWFLTSNFIVEADYRYTILDRGEVTGERANSNHVTLWFIYQPNTVN